MFCRRAVAVRRLSLLSLYAMAIAAPALSAQIATDPTPAPNASAPQAGNTATKPLAFDVVTITRNTSGAGQATIQSPQTGDSVMIRNMPVRMILGFAYDLARYNSIDGLPAWADTENYDIAAKVAAADLPAFQSLLPRQRNPMLQPILIDRFHLQSHFESRQMPAYALVAGKGKPKLTEVQPALAADGRTVPGGIRMGPGEIVATAATLAPLVDALSVQLGRPVVDRTGLTGHYSFTIKFAPVQAATDAQTDALPSLFTALEDQLGLKLESTKAPVPVLVIGHIERPTAN